MSVFANNGGSMFEIQPTFGRALVTALARMDVGYGSGEGMRVYWSFGGLALQ